ncbi:hypothetical protein [Oleiagrimonas soli]|uniref:Uncharacterized protein n=1 Tax=Oleiagrimonas soli TaxID=1543381 RepID=A0A841KPB0_9GAMM|nr:hypothetical protein [Oleiagrimonas soli]MBB6184491.1 hypothetical protein [Oleiagrimonas soli]
MNIRIVVHIVLSTAAGLGAAALRLHGPLLVRNLSAPDRGLRFAGAAHARLIADLLGFSAFARVVARAWHRGSVPLPPRGTIRPDMAYRVRLMVRFRCLRLPMPSGLFDALLCAQRVSTGDRLGRTSHAACAPHARCAIVRLHSVRIAA